jgi:hypothetical protein
MCNSTGRPNFRPKEELAAPKNFGIHNAKSNTRCTLALESINKQNDKKTDIAENPYRVTAPAVELR